MGEQPVYLPQEWADDQTMDVMFSPFRASRDLNAASWDSKMKFWSDVIFSHCLHHKTFLVSGKTLPHTFQRKGKQPVCLDVVLSEMKKLGKLQSLSEFQNSYNTSWTSWGYGVLVKKPASWTYDLLVKKPWQWTATKMFGSQTGAGDEQTVEEQFVDVRLVQAMADAVFQCHRQSMQNQLTDSVLEYKHLQLLCKDVCPDALCFQLAVMQLCKDGKCAITDISSTDKLVKFAMEDEKKVTAANENDVRILKLKSSQDVLEKQIVDLTEEMEQCRLEAKGHLAEGRKSSAKNCLKRKKRLEQVRDSKDSALDNLQHMLTLIQQLDSNKMIVDAYKSGNEAFKDMSQRYGLTPDMIDDAMSEIQEVKDLSDDINASMSQSVDPLEPSMDDLEQELDSLLAGGEGELSIPVLPSPPRHQVHQPAERHQEMVDAMCQMKVVQDEDYLPAPPTFDPASPPKLSNPTSSKKMAVPELS